METGSALPRDALDVFPADAIVLDSDGTLLRANDSWRELSEDVDDELFPGRLGVEYLDRCIDSSRSATTAVAEGIETVLDGDDGPLSLVYPPDELLDGHRFLIRITGFDHDGERYGLIVFVDLTDVAADRLHFRERTRIQTLEAAISVISHDLKTPLNLASGYAELLEEELEDRRDLLEQIRTAIARADTIIDDAIVLAHSEVQEVEEVDLRTVARETWDDLEAVRREDTLDVDDTFTLEADRGLLERALENLFANAIKHAGPDVSVRVGTLEAPARSTAGFFVEDDGPGLPDGAADNIFRPGYTTDSDDGYGLGLTVVREVARAHGWDVTVTAADDGGARFEFTGVETDE